MGIQLPRSSSQPAPSKYERLGLKDQPFPTTPLVDPYSPDPRRNGAIYATAPVQPLIDKFEQMLIRPNDFLNRTRLAFLWSKGDQYSGRGMGKTALLQYFRQRINRDWGSSEFNGAFSAAVLYTAFPQQVDRRFMEQLAWSALVDLCKGDLLKASRAALRANVIGGQAAKIVAAGDGLQDAARLLDDDALRQHDLSPEEIDSAVNTQLCAAQIAPAVAAAFAAGTFEQSLRSYRRDGIWNPTTCLVIPKA